MEEHRFDEAFIGMSEFFEGDLQIDNLYRTIYSTDASAYREKPLAVLIAANKKDIKKAIDFANKNNITLIPRTAGTSIAGQVVGGGLIVDCSKYMNSILEINTGEHWVRLQPGVVLDELNKILEPLGLFFGPETSTSNRCMMGGMLGNNSCGAHSIVYGSVRDHCLEVKAFLSDGSEVIFKELTTEEFEEKCSLNTMEGKLYRQIKEMLNDSLVRQRIDREFPDPEIKRRNTGYAIDILSHMQPFHPEGKKFNFCSLICGSEGTLAFVTEIKLNLVPLPPKHKGLLVVHHHSIAEALEANIEALKHNPVAIELIDKFLLDCTLSSAEHRKNRFFLEGEPEALLCVEFAEDSKEKIEEKSHTIIEQFKQKGYGFHYPLLYGSDISKVWALRKAGLGLLSNIPGDAKPQPVIEDTAVSPQKLPQYIAEFNETLKKNGLNCVYYAHIATGELHLRPILNLKDKEGVRLFRVVADDISRLVKKYGGSLSGEHGDGRLRGEFIPYMIGKENYELLKQIKKTWDPEGIFNIRKITDTPPMDTNLRFIPGRLTPEFDTVYDFSDTLGIVRMAEKCNGSADCRKSSVIGGTMCPSFQATRDEKNTTRARANMLREVLNNNKKKNRFDNKDLFYILDLCLQCKGCKTECPSGVDMAKLKSEFLYQYYKSHTVPLRNRLVAGFSTIQAFASNISGFYNFFVRAALFNKIIKYVIGFDVNRTLPKVYRKTWRKWLDKNIEELNRNIKNPKGEVILFIDEFINFNEPYIGISATKLLNKLGYRVQYKANAESGRAKISKGRLNCARQLAEKNVKLFSEIVDLEKPLVGIEPSAILTFRDEYPDLLKGELKEKAMKLKDHTFTIEEFISREAKEGKITSESFADKVSTIQYHGHCQQKSLTGTDSAKQMLVLPKNYKVIEIKSGCCGMAGSFGYEKEHSHLSNRIGELVLFPTVRNAKTEDIIAVSGTSCRHHIFDNTKKTAKHPVEILFEALKTE